MEVLVLAPHVRTRESAPPSPRMGRARCAARTSGGADMVRRGCVIVSMDSPNASQRSKYFVAEEEKDKQERHAV